MSGSVYENPLCTRYAGNNMQRIFSDDNRYGIWRRLWLALAKGEKALGLEITEQMISEMESNLDNIDYETVARREKEVRHDVMAHVYAFGLVAPHAKPIIHLGATSCFVTDNGDIIIFREAMLEIRNKLLAVVKNLKNLAERYKWLPCLAYTHLQPAQLTTVGKRFTLYIQDLLMDLEALDFALSQLKLRGVKGTTGTQASFLTLFDGDGDKVDRLEKFVAKEMGFDKVFDVSGQTYTRKLDYTILSALSAIAQSAYKFSNDMRILQSRKEMEEPFEKNQIGSSAMAYKRNPMRSERMGSLARFVLTLPLNEAVTASTQWFERTLDDSANRRITIPQAFLALDGVLSLYENITSAPVVYEKVVLKHVREELPFMATESILMEAVKRGGDRQELHEIIRVCSMQAAENVKKNGGENNLIELLAQRREFEKINLDRLTDPALFVGRAQKQTERYLADVVCPLLEANPTTESDSEIKV
mgnify:FL=1